MLLARVSNSLTSESLIAFSLSTFCRLILPVTFSPTIIGTYTADFGGSVPGTFLSPNAAVTASKFLLISIFSGSNVFLKYSRVLVPGNNVRLFRSGNEYFPFHFCDQKLQCRPPAHQKDHGCDYQQDHRWPGYPF